MGYVSKRADRRMTANLWRMLDERGWSNAELARRSGIASSHVSMILANRNGVTLRTARAFRDALGCTWDELLE